ncbi:NAD(P)-dependent oxidoreductase [Streptomyces sp. ACA25]|uniref:NAD-dependent epimerase/dehydratase family protein n=1 Tax=Streptomyces sp. ACA25 TaxID=3022596 RepID=UPI0023075F7D|nr:NAD(P)-dependent oxidoreductase [Streptomyces sp. ACA25]MDB1090150.1 NAD(P)-dependent oxidoreductase [Streptomyces sp. ACA25]
MTAGSRPLVVILGASGFIGSALTRALARRPVRLRVVARRNTPVPADAVAGIEVRTADLASAGAVADAVAGADAVAHLVAHTDAGWRVTEGDTAAERVNVGLVRDLVEAVREGRCRPRPAVLFPSTITHPSGETGPGQVQSPYVRQKLRAEEMLTAATSEGVLRGVPVCLPTVFGHGPGTTAPDRGVVATMTRRALAGEGLTMWGDGSVRRDLLYIDDVVDALLAALDHADTMAGRHWSLGTGVGVPLSTLFADIAAAVAEHTGRPAVPVESVEPPASADPADSEDVVVDSSPFRAATGWQPRVPLREALRRTVTSLASEAR